MRSSWRPSMLLHSLLFLSALPVGVFGDDILKTDGFSLCGDASDIKVEKMNLQFDKANSKITFDVAGTSNKQQQVTASLIVLAYGQQVYKKDFDPCDNSTKVAQLCPIPQGSFSAQGSQDVPASFVKQIPDIAFSVPNLDGTARLELKAKDSGKTVSCIQSTVGNGKSMTTKAVPVIAAGIAGGALAVSALSSLMAGGQPGTASPSPNFFEVVTWFQSMAMNGMLSVEYPSVYRSFANNFAFSGFLIPWDGMLRTIDDFRAKTGGNLTEDSVDYLRNATLVYQSNSNLTKRGLSLFAREVVTNAGAASQNNTSDSKSMHYVHGIQAFAEQMAIPKSDTFMTALMILGIVIAAIIVGILLFKVILEIWALFGKLPQSLVSIRQRYWIIIAKTITQLILLVYGIWTLWCVFQFVQGDSWAAKLLAGITLAIFTAILAWFTWRIWSIARKYKASEGDASALYDKKEIWRNYSIFYENFKKSYWWLFIPLIVYMFAKGVVIAAADGKGLIQTGGQLIIEAVMLILLLWLRPFNLKSSNWINITIQVVRVLSVLCILVFVEQLHVPSTPKTVVGLVLIVMQSVLTGILAILIAVNGIIVFCRANPHRKARKEAEKNREVDSLTPLEPHNSLLYPDGRKRAESDSSDVESQQRLGHRREASNFSQYRNVSGESEISRDRSPNPSVRQPLLPNVNYGGNPQYMDTSYQPYQQGRY